MRVLLKNRIIFQTYSLVFQKAWDALKHPISESVNQAVEQGDKVFACFLDVKKAFDTVWHNGLLFKLYEELSIDSGLWLIIRDLYQDHQAHVIHGGQLSSKFPISQGPGQGRILAPFMNKVYINSLIRKICDLKVGICLTNRFCSNPTFADDMTLLGLHASALSTIIRCAYDYCCKWRYEYHNEKSGIVVFGETPTMHGRMINTTKFFIGSSLIEEVKEYTNLGIYKITVALLQPTLMRISRRPGKGRHVILS